MLIRGDADPAALREIRLSGWVGRAESGWSPLLVRDGTVAAG